MSIQNYRSGIAAIEPLVYITDRNNELREPLEHFDTVQPDWDIDRAGSKSRVEITTYRDVLEDYMWIAPYQRIIPETGDIIEQQLGHFRLDRPSDATDGEMHRDGSYKVVQEAVGADIVDDIAAVMLPWTFYTPRSGLILHDVRNLIQLATCGQVGPNLVNNSGFEDGLTGWNSGGSASGDNSTIEQTGNPSAPEGRMVARLRLNAGATHAQNRYVWQEVNIPPETRYVYMSALAYIFSTRYFEGTLQAAIETPSGTVYANAEGFRSTHNGWYRHFGVIELPDDWSQFRVYAVTRPRSGVSPTPAQSHMIWDDIRVGTCTQMPLPDSRINLPNSTVIASTYIQTTVGDSIGYTAINEHRLGAIAHHALFTELDGRLTTAPSRSLANATVVRQFGRDDFELVGEVRTERAARRPYNHFQAIKEDFTGENPTLYANAYNEDPLDRRSIHHAPLNSAPPIQAPDAVNQAALQALADAARDRESENEVLQIRVRPGEALRAHDVIEITESENPRAVGRWLVEYIRPGMTPDDPLVEIGARRARSQEVS